MSHCTSFKFQYVNRKCIIQTFKNIGLDWHDGTVVSYNSETEKMLRINAYDPTPAIIASKDDFNYFMKDKGGYYELSIEKHNMNSDEEHRAKNMAKEFKREYIKTTMDMFKDKLEKKGINCILNNTKKGWKICFGKTYEKSVLVNFDGKNIEEQVSGIKGGSCSSLTRVLEDMLSSPEVDLHTRWTEEYYQTEEDDLKVYNLS